MDSLVLGAIRWFICTLALLVAAGCERTAVVDSPATTSTTVTLTGPTMGTVYNVRAVLSEQASPQRDLQESIDLKLAEINRLMSTYDAESELSRFNQSESLEWVDVSAETAKVVGFALKVAQETDGAFDPTIGPLVNLWGFGPDGRRREPPTADEIEQSLQAVGYHNVEVRQQPPALRKQLASIYLDLSAIAKGYGVDAVNAVLMQEGSRGSMTEIGGEIVCRGSKPGGEPWRIGIERPDPAGRTYQAVLELGDEAIATSGDYRNFFELEGKRYSHTIDPATGRPVEHQLATVSVRAASCMEADAFATALLVMGPQRGYDWAVEEGVAALLVERTEGGYSERVTPAWKQELAETNP